ncbi:MAG: anthranilate synthase component I family protein [Deltaproteobacteria bacterium]|nr:MAG: anthranilate synthase component I family protein [Deltaproteobacteria bacterium]
MGWTTLHIPVDTDASAGRLLAALAPNADAVLLHSGIGDTARGQRSIIALELAPAAQATRDTVLVFNDKGSPAVLPHGPRPMARLDQTFARDRRGRACTGRPSLGWIGYLAWEAAHLCDPAIPPPDVELPFPALRFDRVRAALVLPPEGGPRDTPQPTLIVEGETEHAARVRAERWAHFLAHLPPEPPPGPLPTVVSAPDDEHYRDGVRRIRSFIRDGRVYQACLTTPFRLLPPPPGPARLALARTLREASPGDYAFHLRMGPLEVLSTSPEQFLRVRGNRITTRPMKGTRPRAGEDDLETAGQLATAQKDRAENLMIVDLLRNDLNRVCVPGSVVVPRLFEVETYRTVFQMTSTIEGDLLPGTGPFAILEAVFPPGSMSGAPKIEALAVLRELEPDPRGLYAGAVGWIGYDGDMDLGVVIRSLQIVGDDARWDVGGGIVWESTPEDEWREALAKARPIGIDAPES